LKKAVVTFISESDSTRLISHESAFGAVRQALVAGGFRRRERVSGRDRTRVGSAEHLLAQVGFDA
jgi:hypothetical protein